MRNLLFILIILSIIACSNKETSENKVSEIHQITSLSGMLAADTIIYDVIIRNPNPDDSWTESCLRGFKRMELIDSIFALIYKGQAEALDFDTHLPMKIKDIKQLENSKDFSRDRIGKIQFKEKWFFNTRELTFTKEIISMVLGYEVYDDSGELRGYKPAFIINFNEVLE